MGCILCADAERRQATAKRGEVPLQQRGAEVGKQAEESCPRAWRTTGNWARFEARPGDLTAGAFRQHAWSDKHKTAVRAFLCQARQAVLPLQADASDDAS